MILGIMNHFLAGRCMTRSAYANVCINHVALWKTKGHPEIFSFWLHSPRLSCLRTKVHCIQIFHSIILIITARSELCKVLFWRWCWLFLFAHEISRNCWTDLHQICREDEFVFGPSLGRVWMSRSKVKVTRDKNGIFRPFRRPACGFCFIKHL